MPRKIRTTVIQMDANPAPTDERIVRAQQLIEEAVAAGAALVMLPELFNIGYQYAPTNHELAERMNGRTVTWLRDTWASTLLFHKTALETMINQMKRIVISLGLLLLLVGCDGANSDDNDVAKFSLLDGDEFVLEVDKVLLEIPSAQLPTDDLQENDYKEINDGVQYHVTLSEDGQRVTIEPGSEPGSMRGHRINDGDESKLYELDEGVFAGGRFVVWRHDDRFQAELTIYGSGVPIAGSERGYLVPGQ